MPIEKVEMTRITCDVCRVDDGSEYWAWNGFEQASDYWREGDGIVTQDGRAFCDKHIPADVCRDTGGAHDWTDDECPDCGADREETRE